MLKKDIKLIESHFPSLKYHGRDFDAWERIKKVALNNIDNLPSFEEFEKWVHDHGGMDNRNIYNWFMGKLNHER